MCWRLFLFTYVCIYLVDFSVCGVHYRCDFLSLTQPTTRHIFSFFPSFSFSLTLTTFSPFLTLSLFLTPIISHLFSFPSRSPSSSIPTHSLYLSALPVARLCFTILSLCPEDAQMRAFFHRPVPESTFHTFPPRD